VRDVYITSRAKNCVFCYTIVYMGLHQSTRDVVSRPWSWSWDYSKTFNCS